jgi:hexosaminidase
LESWGHGYPEIVAKCKSYEWNLNLIPLNPASNLTYEVVEGVLSAMRQPFTDKYVHLGGDEVFPGCWNEDERIKKFMDENGLTIHTLQEMFQGRIEKIYQKFKKTVTSF